jgi:uncharacterized protein
MLQTVWIELPVKDINRALQFYKTVFQLGDIAINDDGTRKTATLANTGEGGSPGLSLTQVAGFNPSDRSGVWLYLSTGEDFDGHVARVKEAGGTLVDERVSMGEAGAYTSFIDTEGNLLSLYTYP